MQVKIVISKCIKFNWKIRKRRTHEYTNDYFKIKFLSVWFGLVSLFNDISSIGGYLMSQLSLKDSSKTI